MDDTTDEKSSLLTLGLTEIIILLLIGLAVLFAFNYFNVIVLSKISPLFSFLPHQAINAPSEVSTPKEPPPTSSPVTSNNNNRENLPIALDDPALFNMLLDYGILGIVTEKKKVGDTYQIMTDFHTTHPGLPPFMVHPDTTFQSAVMSDNEFTQVKKISLDEINVGDKVLAEPLYFYKDKTFRNKTWFLFRIRKLVESNTNEPTPEQKSTQGQ